MKMIKKITVIFLSWRAMLFLLAFFAGFIFPQFGNRFPYSDQALKVTDLPSFVWGFGNFDGVHYLRIAQNGYDAEFTQAFFPLYPLLIRSLVSLDLFIHKNPMLDTHIFVDPSYFFNGLLLSNIFFLLALVFYYKLIRIDFSHKIAFGSFILLLSFPTSFYFGSIYPESLFLALILSSIFLWRKKYYLGAGCIAALASATKLIGILLPLIFLVEIYQEYRKSHLHYLKDDLMKALSLLIASSGLLLYMLYLQNFFHNPFYFLTAQPFFGADRSGVPVILLPQVLFRYGRMLVTIPLATLSYLNLVLELIFTLVPLIFLCLNYKKIRPSYLVFSLAVLVIPTLTGTLSSMPRYALMIVLAFPVLAKWENKYYYLLLSLFIILGAILTTLFVRGYWVA